VSRVTKLMKRPRRRKPWRRPRKRATHFGARTVVFGPGRLVVGGVEVGALTDVSIDFGSFYREVPMEMGSMTVHGTCNWTHGDAP
jgi:hypothetical protein